MMMSLKRAVVEVLIELLRWIEMDDNMTLIEEDHPLIRAVDYLSVECLMIDNNYVNVQVLKDAGYDVGCLEGDTFGWLSGWIATKKGDIVFG
jgi:hypothetical protein